MFFYNNKRIWKEGLTESEDEPNGFSIQNEIRKRVLSQFSIDYEQDTEPEALIPKYLKINLDEASESKIKKVRTGSNSEIIAISISIKANIDILMVWNVIGDFEFEAYELDTNYKVIFDENGNPFIIT